MSDWFQTRLVTEGVWLIAEPSHVNTWLIEGSERAVLLDTGLGILPIRPVAESLVSKPISVVNTHYHFDHVGGNHEFDEIAIHAAGAGYLTESVPAEWLIGYARYIDRMLEAALTYRRLDQEFFHLLTPDSDPRPLPLRFDLSSWTIEPSRATHMIADGDCISLGDRDLTVLHTPGHTPDGICLLDQTNGLLFGGDTINTGPLYAQRWDSNLEDFAASTRRLAELESEIRLIMVHHFGRVLAEPTLLAEIADGFARIRNGEVALAPAVDCIDSPVLQAHFGRFSVFLPDPNAVEHSPFTSSAASIAHAGSRA
jgi:glyoxylase-like metal-dependent hydrolase (beta-lactamase superfamily II)